MTKESLIQTRVRLAVARLATMFRQNVGLGWVGKTERRADGSIVIRNPRPLHAGLVKGSGDLIGWRSITIQPHHVGKKIAQFASLEIKTKTGRPTDEQKNWHLAVQRAGGISAVVRSPEEAVEILKEGLP